MKAYKGFNPDMTCRDFQYEEGKEYETDKAKLCECGFHACEAPLDVFGYYPPINDNGELNKFHEVELEEISDEKSDDTKVVAKKIKIGAELNFFGLAKAHVEWVKNRVEKDKTATNTGDYSVATNTGFQSVATNTGERSVATSTGFQSVATNTGENSVAVAWGAGGKARAALGSYIVVSEWSWDEKRNKRILLCAKMAQVDGKQVKANTFYKLKNGELVEVEEK